MNDRIDQSNTSDHHLAHIDGFPTGQEGRDNSPLSGEKIKKLPQEPYDREFFIPQISPISSNGNKKGPYYREKSN